MSRWTPIETHWSQEMVRAHLDAELACERAAEITSDAVLIALFREAALEHANMGRQLSALIATNSGSAPTHGTASGLARRVWLDIVGNLKSDEDDFLLEQVLKFEARALEVCSEALMRMSSAQIAPLARKHKAKLFALRETFAQRRSGARLSA